MRVQLFECLWRRVRVIVLVRTTTNDDDGTGMSGVFKCNCFRAKLGERPELTLQPETVAAKAYGAAAAAERCAYRFSSSPILGTPFLRPIANTQSVASEDERRFTGGASERARCVLVCMCVSGRRHCAMKISCDGRERPTYCHYIVYTERRRIPHPVRGHGDVFGFGPAGWGQGLY